MSGSNLDRTIRRPIGDAAEKEAKVQMAIYEPALKLLDSLKWSLKTEVYAIPDLLEHGSETALKGVGKLRIWERILLIRSTIQP